MNKYHESFGMLCSLFLLFRDIAPTILGKNTGSCWEVKPKIRREKVNFVYPDDEFLYSEELFITPL